jgi:putative ABC transport system permease protein
MNSVLLSFRKLRKNKTTTTLGIAGLIVGLICVMYIFFWVNDEISYDRFHARLDRIFVVHAYLEEGSNQFTFQGCPPAVGTALTNEYPEVENSCRFFPAYQQSLLSFGEQKFMQGVAFSDYSLFDIFSFPFVYGNIGEANTPKRIILTQTVAAQYFGDQDPVGKIIRFNNQTDLTVVGVIKDIPHNSTLTFDAVMPLENLKVFFSRDDFLSSWYNNAFTTYGLLKNAEGYQKVASTITRRIQKEIPESTNFLRAYQFKDGYLYEQKHIRNVRIFILIGVLVLLAATLNFINLCTARSTRQAKESGLRKAVGASRLNLIRLIYTDVAIVCFLAFTVAILLALSGLSFFNQTIHKEIGYSALFAWKPMLVLFLVYGFTVLLAGSYPALYLSAFSPVKTLTSNYKTTSNRSLFRNSLVIVIFVVSIVLLGSTIVISRQTKFMQRIDLGIEKDQLMYVSLKGRLKDRTAAIKEEIGRSSDVLASSVISFLPSMIGNNGEDWEWEGKDVDFKPLITNWETDEGFLNAFGAQMIEGRYFEKDQEGIVINKAFADIIGWDSFTGKKLVWGGTPVTILGVVKNIRFNTLNKATMPMAIQMTKSWSNNFLAIKFNASHVKEVLEDIQKTCNNIEPDIPLEYGFMSDEYAKLLESETNLYKLIGIFSLFSMLVLCLGLLGFIMFMAEQKIKEIGIRKCMGETGTAIISHLLKPFLITGFIAWIIATPLTWYLMDRWLQGYSSRIHLNLWIFMGAGIVTIAIALLTVSWQSWKAANRNPVEALRYE